MQVYKVTVLDRTPGRDLPGYKDLPGGGLYAELTQAKMYCEVQPDPDPWPRLWVEEEPGKCGFGNFRIEELTVIENFDPEEYEALMSERALGIINGWSDDDMTALHHTGVVNLDVIDQLKESAPN